MEAKKLALVSAPIAMMLAILFAMGGIETWVAGFGKTPESFQALGRIGLALPYVTAAAIGIIFLLATRGSLAIQSAGLGVLLGGAAVAAIGMIGEATRIMSMIDWVPDGQIGNYLDLYTLGGSAVATGSALFGTQVAMPGNLAFGSYGPAALAVCPDTAGTQ
ncbi:conjugal transfer protein TraG, partial [Sinorhizobium meliloti]